MTERELMLTSILNCRKIDLYTKPLSLSSEQEQILQDMQKRRQQGEPLQYIIGSCDFMGLMLFVDDRVLIPRPETELLVDEVVAQSKEFPTAQQLRILDLGTGSGNIAISLAKFIPHSQVTAVDISKAAIQLAKDNARFHQVEGKITFVRQDMHEFLNQAVSGQKKFDIIVSNPPYVPSGELKSLPHDVKHEPQIALNGGKDGLDYYEVIVEACAKLLAQDGLLFCEMGDNQAKGVEEILRRHQRFSSQVFKKDYTGTDRIVVAQ